MYMSLELSFMAYRTWQTQEGAGDWDLSTEARVLTPDKEDRLIYAVIAFFMYTILLMVFLLARARYDWLYSTISPAAMFILCFY